ncbi:uncharacterized protein DMAD_11160 [Drosophila madeirensis]|uniref:BACK domain-containing protein n=1 Tax=Drosophila madeirensis TaxID=30013 RepID=A0AAU9FCA4_DROMD
MSDEVNDNAISIWLEGSSDDDDTASGSDGNDGHDGNGTVLREKEAFEIWNYFLALVGTEQLAELMHHHKETLLKSDNLGINQELEAFLVVLHWVATALELAKAAGELLQRN